MWAAVYPRNASPLPHFPTLQKRIGTEACRLYCVLNFPPKAPLSGGEYFEQKSRLAAAKKLEWVQGNTLSHSGLFVFLAAAVMGI